MTQEQPASRWRTASSTVWGLLAGLVGSLCCIGPSAAILLGLGSSSTLFGLHVDQRLAILAGTVLLVFGSTIALRRARVCDLRPHARWRQLALMVVSGVLAYSTLGVLLPWLAVQQEVAAVAPQPASALAAPVLRRATLLVEKMDCPPCVSHLNALLARKPFIQRFSAEVNNEQVTVEYDSRQVAATDLLAFIPQSYEAKIDDDTPLP